MKLQDMVDEGKMSPGAVPQNFQNKNQTVPQIEISIYGIGYGLCYIRSASGV